ncbi:MAG: peptide chain release factor N(5)-glutamine methyltransferase [Acaryochloris sp. RU_4_1]|nr:peptide chain release factor N(5)-glutamine methyltransferase [Acaryochloris sp. RU_4_1]NJR55020.1 peptide chain release factor N(5)-glutamine methyltransferase [Acaryochloris sp. CRU_2_0]
MVLNPLIPRHPKSNLSPNSLAAIPVATHSFWQWRSQAIADLSQHCQTRSYFAELRKELDWLLLEVSNLSALDLRLERVTPESVHLQLPFEELKWLWQRRLQQRVPVQHLTGTVHWRQFHLQISQAVLIPRPETELLIDLALATEPPLSLSGTTDLWADLGTGSGVIALGLATAFPEAAIHAIDCSATALAIAEVNRLTYHLQDRIHFHLGHWFEPLRGLEGQFRGIVSNPPYIPTDILPSLEPEVFEHEPHLALDGGTDGLDTIREIIAISPIYLHSGGVLLLEMMRGQDHQVTTLLQSQGHYSQIQIHPDLAGINRFAIAYRI